MVFVFARSQFGIFSLSHSWRKAFTYCDVVDVFFFFFTTLAVVEALGFFLDLVLAEGGSEACAAAFDRVVGAIVQGFLVVDTLDMLLSCV